MTRLLEIDQLQVTYATGAGDLPAVRGVSLTIDAGESVGVAGESGSGKSSVAATILRLQPNNASVGGAIRFKGDDILKMSWGKLRAVRWAGASIIFQGALHSLNPVRKIGAQIAEPIRLHEPKISEAEADKRVRDLLQQVGLPPVRANSYPHQMSGGQKQRVMIALALACRPDLIIADEPTTALDVMVQAQVLSVLTGLVRELGLGLLLISHDLSVLSATCDRIVVMYAGRIVEEGPADQIFDQPHHPYSGALSAAFPRVGDMSARFAPAGLAGDPPYPGDLPSGCTFHVRCPWATQECAETDPQLHETVPGRWVACIHADGTNAKLDTPRALVPRDSERSETGLVTGSPRE